MKGKREGMVAGTAAQSTGVRMPFNLCVAGLVLAFILSFATPLATVPAFANMYATSDAAAAVENPESSQVGNNANADGAAEGASEAEEIDDEDVPMVSGLGGAEPVTNVSSRFQWIIIAGIAAVVAFFVFSVVKLNRSISKMKDRF